MATKTKKSATTEEVKTGVVETVEQLEELISRVKAAQKEFATFSQEKVDAIFKAAATAADKMRIPLAKMAVEETGMGVMEDKVYRGDRLLYSIIPSRRPR